MHITNAKLEDAGYTIKQEEEIYNYQLQDIMDNTRRYLDSFHSMVTYKVRWKDYRTSSPTLPYCHIKQSFLNKTQPNKNNESALNGKNI